MQHTGGAGAGEEGAGPPLGQSLQASADLAPDGYGKAPLGFALMPGNGPALCRYQNLALLVTRGQEQIVILQGTKIKTVIVA